MFEVKAIAFGGMARRIIKVVASKEGDEADAAKPSCLCYAMS